MSHHQFKITIDTSACRSLIAGSNIELNDTWYYSNQCFESGKIYGIVSEHGQGCSYLSYLIGGRIDFENVIIRCNDETIDRKYLNGISWNLEPSCEPYGKKQVRKAIEKALAENLSNLSFKEIADQFY